MDMFLRQCIQQAEQSVTITRNVRPHHTRNVTPETDYANFYSMGAYTGTEHCGVFNEGIEAFLNMTGLGPYCFSISSGKVDPINLIKICQSGREYILTQPSHLLTASSKGYLLFVIATDLDISPKMHKKVYTKWLDWKLSVHTRMLYFTKRSSVLTTDIIDRETKEILVRQTVKFVYVPTSARAPSTTSLPEWTKTAGLYGKDESAKKPINIKKPEKIPLTAFSYPYRVTYADLDLYQHTTNFVYPRLCMDVGSVACEKETFSGLQGSIYSQRVRKIRGFYAKESGLGDLLEVQVWQDADDTHTLHFNITKGNDTVYFGDIVLYKEKTSSVPAKL